MRCNLVVCRPLCAHLCLHVPYHGDLVLLTTQLPWWVGRWVGAGWGRQLGRALLSQDGNYLLLTGTRRVFTAVRRCKAGMAQYCEFPGRRGSLAEERPACMRTAHSGGSVRGAGPAHASGNKQKPACGGGTLHSPERKRPWKEVPAFPSSCQPGNCRS